MPSTVSVREWERQVFKQERIRIVVRAQPSEQVAPYVPLSKQSRNDLYVDRFIQAHLRPQLNGKSVEVISPTTGAPVFGEVPLSTLRQSRTTRT